MDDNDLKDSRIYLHIKFDLLNRNMSFLKHINSIYSEIFFKEKCKIIEDIRYEICHIYKPIFYKFIKENK